MLITPASTLRRCTAALLCALIAFALAPPAQARDVAQIQSREIAPLGPPGVAAEAFPPPDRPVADIISPVWASEDERRSADETGQVFALMNIREGQRVADIGAGTGYYTMALAKRLGALGEVFAQEITPRYLAALDARVKKAKLGNVRVGRGAPHDPLLPQGALDAALLIHMYHEIAQPYALLHNLARALKPGALVGVVDPDRPTNAHGTPPALLRCEFAAAGYREVGFHTLRDKSYLAVFTPVLPLPEPAAIKPCRAGG